MRKEPSANPRADTRIDQLMQAEMLFPVDSDPPLRTPAERDSR